MEGLETTTAVVASALIEVTAGKTVITVITIIAVRTPSVLPLLSLQHRQGWRVTHGWRVPDLLWAKMRASAGRSRRRGYTPPPLSDTRHLHLWLPRQTATDATVPPFRLALTTNTNIRATPPSRAEEVARSQQQQQQQQHEAKMKCRQARPSILASAPRLPFTTPFLSTTSRSSMGGRALFVSCAGGQWRHRPIPRWGWPVSSGACRPSTSNNNGRRQQQRCLLIPPLRHILRQRTIAIINNPLYVVSLALQMTAPTGALYVRGT